MLAEGGLCPRQHRSTFGPTNSELNAGVVETCVAPSLGDGFVGRLMVGPPIAVSPLHDTHCTVNTGASQELICAHEKFALLGV